MLRTLGADLVGMSTTLEAIAARDAGAEVLGISLVTNLAAGMTGEPLDHLEVLAAGNASAARMGALLAQVVSQTVNYEAAARAWLAEDPDADTRAELSSLLESRDDEGLAERFVRALAVRHCRACAARSVRARTG